MSNTMLLVFAVAIFSLMLIGIILTILEFSRGEPAQQEAENRLDDSGRKSASGR